MITKKIDIAVHSLKDIPYKETSGLIIKTFLKRNSPREVLISRNNLSFENLKKNSIIGTSSFRREFQLKVMRPDLKFKLIRGNIDSRIKKIYEKKYDAIIPCGIKDKGITNLKQIKDQNYNELKNKLIEIFKTNLKNLIF